MWLRLGEAVTQAYRVRAEREGVRGGRAIIMAGPPGAGKSHGVDAVRNALGPEESKRLGVMEDGFITVDADDVKQILLGNPVPGLEIDPDLLAQARDHWDGLIDEHAPEALADGKPLLRGELATLVHPLSTATAGKVREDLLEDQFDVKIEGTLKGKEKGASLVQQLRKQQYEQVTVVAVDTPRQICLEGAHRRWVEPRGQGDVTARYTPPEAVNSTFIEGRASSRCIDNARATHQLASAQSRFTQVDLFIAHRTPTGTVVEHIDRDGRSRSVTLNATAPPTRSAPVRTLSRSRSPFTRTPHTTDIGR
ncbi:zeta toxin family protein [Arachnia propionica]|uniref:zeta toxin family protein n=1 Tax=Arachnia propionica TaxID=1750 RepID=UPI0016397A8F|nr:zeta toxin family protein [Arachnia propionica]